MALPVPIKWTQHIYDVYVTAPVVEPIAPVVNIGSSTLSVSYETSDGKKFTIALDTYGDVVVEKSEFIILTRSIKVRLRKAVPAGKRKPDFWPRMTKDKVKLAHLTVDWDTWKDEEDLVDEDEEGEQGKAFGEAMGFRMSNGTTISGGGDPAAIAALQKQYQVEAAR